MHMLSLAVGPYSVSKVAFSKNQGLATVALASLQYVLPTHWDYSVGGFQLYVITPCSKGGLKGTFRAEIFFLPTLRSVSEEELGLQRSSMTLKDKFPYLNSWDWGKPQW